MSPHTEPAPPPQVRLLAALVIAAFGVVMIYWMANPTPRDRVTGMSTGYRININEADADELQLLPSIGPARAERIVEYRLANEPFAHASDLIQINTIGPVIAEGVEPYICFE